MRAAMRLGLALLGLVLLPALLALLPLLLWAFWLATPTWIWVAVIWLAVVALLDMRRQYRRAIRLQELERFERRQSGLKAKAPMPSADRYDPPSETVLKNRPFLPS